MSTSIDRDKLLSIGVMRRSQPAVREWRDDAGERHRATTDELGHTVTEHARGDRQDVLIRAPRVAVRSAVSEEMD
jgi:hypothetical protein